MVVGKGLIVFGLAVLWIVTFPVMVIVETLRYGCELVVDSVEAAWEDVRTWVDRKEKV